MYSKRFATDALSDLAYLPKVSTAEVAQVIEDVSLSDQGVHVHYCVDPSELIDFCFPFNPIALRAKQVEHVAADQVALYELLFNFPERPLLLPEYDAELESVRIYFRTMSGRIYKREELLTSFLKNASLDRFFQQRLDSETELLSLVRDEFNVFVALVMAINSIGVQRLEEIYNQRLSREIGRSEPTLRAIWNGYSESGLARTIFGELETYARRRAGWSATERGSLLHFARTARTDATAADRLVYLNESCEDAVRRRVLQSRHVFLFLSSAARSERIFADLPVTLGGPYEGQKSRQLLRNRRYFLIYAVNKALNARGEVDTAATLSNLRSFHNAVKEIERLGAIPADCGSCPLRQDSSATDCSRGELCMTLKRVAGNLIRRRLEMENLGLLAGIQDYSEFRTAKATGGEQQKILRVFRELLDHDYYASTASEKVSELRWLIMTKSRFATALGTAGRGTGGFLREHSDPVSVAAQYLPIQFSWRNSRYKRMWEDLFRVFLSSGAGGHSKHKMLADIHDQFLRVDADVRTVECEHELMRVLLYLSMSEVASDRRAMAHALTMRRRCPHNESEFIYASLWAGRRARRYLKTAQLADAAVRRWPTDPRFWHGRALNTFAWRADPRGGEPSSALLTAAVSDAETAAGLYGAIGEEISRQLAAANHNNIAYWSALMRDDPAFDLARARHALGRLKALLPRREWDPLFPEYFHTEAFLEFREAEAAVAVGDPDRARQKATLGLEQILEACRLDPHDTDYRDLRDDLQRFLQTLK